MTWNSECVKCHQVASPEHSNQILWHYSSSKERNPDALPLPDRSGLWSGLRGLLDWSGLWRGLQGLSDWSRLWSVLRELPNWSGLTSGLWGLPDWSRHWSGLWGLPDWRGLWSGLWGLPDWRGLWSGLWRLPDWSRHWSGLWGLPYWSRHWSGLWGLPDWSGLWSGLWGLPDWSSHWSGLWGLSDWADSGVDSEFSWAGAGSWTGSWASKAGSLRGASKAENLGGAGRARIMGGAGRARIMGETKRSGCSVTSGTSRVESSRTTGLETTRVRSSGTIGLETTRVSSSRTTRLETTGVGSSRTAGLGTTGVDLAALRLLDLRFAVEINGGSCTWLDMGGGDGTVPVGRVWWWCTTFSSLRSCRYQKKSNDLTCSISQCSRGLSRQRIKGSFMSTSWQHSLSALVQNFWAKTPSSIHCWRRAIKARCRSICSFLTAGGEIWISTVQAIKKLLDLEMAAVFCHTMTQDRSKCGF